MGKYNDPNVTKETLSYLMNKYKELKDKQDNLISETYDLNSEIEIKKVEHDIGNIPIKLRLTSDQIE